jgi:hypothetical protein
MTPPKDLGPLDGLTIIDLTALLVAFPRSTVAAWAALTEPCDAAVDVAAASLQIHGGYGISPITRAERHVRDAVSQRAPMAQCVADFGRPVAPVASRAAAIDAC